MDIIQGPIEYFADFFSTVLMFAPRFLPGVWATLLLSLLSILLGTIFGLLATIMKMSRNKFLSKLADFYIFIIRGTPLLLQLFFIFYGLANMGLEFSRFTSAVIGLGIHSGAYISEIFRGSIVSIDHGQTEAARSLGMTKRQTFINIILPQTFKRSVPALGNQFIIAIKDSSLADSDNGDHAAGKTVRGSYVSGISYILCSRGLLSYNHIRSYQAAGNFRGKAESQ